MNKYERTARFYQRMNDLGFTHEEATKLRRIEMTLRRWCELECGDGNDYASWAIERDEESGKPFMVTHPHTGKSYRRRVADREAGALRRLQQLMARHSGLWFYHQSDTRGCALYVGRREDIRTTDNPIVTKATQNGLKIWRHSDPIPAENGRPAIPASYKASAYDKAIFDTPEEAARRFLRDNRMSIPDREFLPLDEIYNSRGFAVCID